VVELHGEKIRVWAYVKDDDIHIEITSAWDPTYEKPVILITTKGKLREDVKSLIDEITQLLQRVVEILIKGEAK
jgi:hypothetical protein